MDNTARTVMKHLNKQFHTGHTSLYTILHMAQIIMSTNFRAFDWKNKDDNRRHYGQDSPPQYHLSTIGVPVAIFWSDNDCLATAKDKLKLEQELTTIINIKEIDYLHLDYLWGEEASSGLYRDIIRLMEERLNLKNHKKS